MLDRYNCTIFDMIRKSIKEMPEEYSVEEQKMWIGASLMAWHEAQECSRKDKDIFASGVFTGWARDDWAKVAHMRRKIDRMNNHEEEDA